MAISVLLWTIPASASGHGPVFGAATPTLGRGGWSFDQAWMGQAMQGEGNSGLLRGMIGYGITERLQISGSVPIPLGSTTGIPLGRMTSMMSGNPDLEGIAAWRFHARPIGQGARFESTVFVGGTVPLQSRRDGIATSPASYIALASGYASRSHYFWAGASYQRYAERSGDRFGSVTSYSIVYGYRPQAWRKDYPKPDLRFFIEASGDATDRTQHDGRLMPNSGGNVLLAGPTLLYLYKAYGVSGGILFPIYQRTNGTQPHERFRFGVNFTYFFWPGKAKGH
jgi:hypothetical protein